MKTRILIPVLLLACGCSELTTVDAPDLVERSDLLNPAGAITFFNGAVSRFEFVFGTRASWSASGAFVNNSGLLSDELIAHSTFWGLSNLDRHLLPEESGSQGTYFFLQVARMNQLQALDLLREVLPSERWRIGLLYGYLGYTETLLAETMCSGVPLSTISRDFKPEYGPPLTTTQLLERALQDFDSAAVYAANDPQILNLARVGRGRVLLNLDRPAEAAGAVGAVLTSFAFLTEHTQAVNYNGLFSNLAWGAFGIADKKGINGLDYLSAEDQRINAVIVGTGLDGVPVYGPARVDSYASPNILATGIEARLIEAEAALRADNVDAWLAHLNSLRATATSPSMAPLTDPGTPDGRVDLLFRERAFWLFLTGSRFGDMRRLVRQYGRAVNTVFPIGPYKFGGEFGTDWVLPIDPTELARNPLMGDRACLDRNP